MLVVLRIVTEQLSGWILQGARFLQSKFMRRTLYSFSIVAILIGVFVFMSPVKADYIQDFSNGLINGLSYILIEIAAIFIQITIFALKFFIEIAGYNNFIDADIVKLGWNMIRDVANMFFVVVLLVIAFGTILGLEQYEWKKTLIKLVMSAFLVNFSNLICQLIIDAAQVFTISFLNAVAGAAGGNLVNMFNLNEVYNIATNNTDPSGIQIELFGGAVMSIVFAGMAMMTIGAYLVVIIARMVVLWTLMILSPLAFLFSALPNTQSYAKEYWDQFIRQVIVAPVMVFFLWLAFATFGGGDVVQKNIERDHPMIVDGGIQPVTSATDNNGKTLGISYSQAASWENMANFAVAIAFLWIGIERVQKLGVVGGGLVSGAISFGKNVATIASGYAVGRWLVGKGKAAAMKGVHGVGSGLYAATLGNTVEIAKNRVAREIEGWKSWRSRGPNAKLEDKRKDATGAYADWKVDEEAGTGKDAAGKDIRRDEETGNWYQVDKEGKWKLDIDEKTGEVRKEFKRDRDGRIQYEENDSRGTIQKMFYNRQQRLLQSRKRLEKVKKQKDVRDQLIDKRVTAIPVYAMQRFEGTDPDALDRVEQGMLEAESMRSAAKTEEFKSLGKQLVLESTRFKDGKFQGKEKGTMVQQLAQHKEAAARTENLVKASQSKARRDYINTAKGAKVVKGKIEAELEMKAADAGAKFIEGTSRMGFINAAKAAMANGQTGTDANDPVLLRMAHMETEAHEVESLAKESESRIKSDTAKHLSDEALDEYVKHLEELEDYNEHQKLIDYEVAFAGQNLDTLKENAASDNEVKKIEEFQALREKWKGKAPPPKPGRFNNLTFEASAARAEANWAHDTLNRSEKSLYDATEQARVYQARGVPMTSTAMEEFMEKQKKNTRELEYHQTLAAVKGNAKAMLARREADPANPNAVTMEDSMVSFAVLDRAMDQSWIDDMAQTIWDDPELHEKIAKQLGWADSDADGVKAGQIQQLVATGWDIEFVKDQQKFNSVISRAYKNGENVLENSGNLGREALGSKWEEHLKKLKRYNEPMQKLGSYKDRAITNSHLENGGHTQFSQDLGVYIPVSADMAHDIVYAEYRKQNKSRRSDVHSHSVGSYNNEFGIITSFRESDYSDAHGANIDARDMQAVKNRNLKNYQFHSANEEVVTDEKGFTQLGGANYDRWMAKKMGQGALLKKGREEQLAKFLQSAEFKAAKKRHIALEAAKQLRGGSMNFVMTLITNNQSLKTDLNGNARKGKINVKIGDEEFGDASQLIDAVNVEVEAEVTKEVTTRNNSETDPAKKLNAEQLKAAIKEEFQKKKVGYLQTLDERVNTAFRDKLPSGVRSKEDIRKLFDQDDEIGRKLKDEVKSLLGREDDDGITDKDKDDIAEILSKKR